MSEKVFKFLVVTCIFLLVTMLAYDLIFRY